MLAGGASGHGPGGSFGALVCGLDAALEWVPVLHGDWPPTVLLSALGLPAGVQLMRLLQRHHDRPALISGSKFLALRFQGWNGLGLSAGLALGRVWIGG